MTSRALISKIHCALSANQKRFSLMYDKPGNRSLSPNQKSVRPQPELENTVYFTLFKLEYGANGLLVGGDATGD